MTYFKVTPYYEIDGEGVAPAIDSVTNAIIGIDYAHHEVHAGRHFMYTDHVSLDDTDTQDYLITTPNTTRWAHMIFFLDGSAITQWQLYEGADRTGTTAQTCGNSNRNSTNIAGVTIHKGQSGGSTDGTQLWLYKSGSASAISRAASSSGNSGEIILAQNTKYILRVTSGSDSNLTNVRLEWYEHISEG